MNNPRSPEVRMSWALPLKEIVTSFSRSGNRFGARYELKEMLTLLASGDIILQTNEALTYASGLRDINRVHAEIPVLTSKGPNVVAERSVAIFGQFKTPNKGEVLLQFGGFIFGKHRDITDEEYQDTMENIREEANAYSKEELFKHTIPERPKYYFMDAISDSMPDIDLE